MEAMINIRTVSSFGYENIVAKRYEERLEKPYKLAIRKGNISGLFYGLSQIVLFVIFGLLFFLGALFVRDNESVEIDDMFTAIYAIMFAGMTAGNNSHFIPDAAACNNSAANIFQIQDSLDEDQMQDQEESKRLKEGIEGDIELNNITFKYNSRSETLFEGLSLTI